jgi:hypothetical protein
MPKKKREREGEGEEGEEGKEAKSRLVSQKRAQINILQLKCYLCNPRQQREIPRRGLGVAVLGKPHPAPKNKTKKKAGHGQAVSSVICPSCL